MTLATTLAPSAPSAPSGTAATPRERHRAGADLRRSGRRRHHRANCRGLRAKGYAVHVVEDGDEASASSWTSSPREPRSGRAHHTPSR